MKKIFTLALLLVSYLGFSQSTTIVISQAYGGGGGSTGTYLYDYVELHNVSNATQSLTGFSLQYGSATGQFASTAANLYAFPAGTTIPAGGYLLIQLGPVGSAGAAFPVTPDLTTGNLTMSGVSGKVALANQATSLSCGATATPCTLPNPAIVDLVAWGTSNNAEGGVSVNNGVAITSTQGSVRKTLGCTDTDNNNADFDVVTAPVPRNSATPVNICGAGSPTLTATALTAFGNVCVNTTAGPNSFTINGSALNATNVTVGALAGYAYSTSAGGPYTATLSLAQAGGAYSQQIFVQFTPTAVQSYNGNIPVGGGGAATINVPASGAGVQIPTVTSGAASSITTTTATVAGTLTSTGCTLTAYGIEWSTTAGFPNGTGTAVPSTNLAGGNFSSNLSGLTASTIYYYHAYATNGSGTGYGAEQSFTTSNPVVPGMVISQVYGGGGNASATYNQDFVELFNRSGSTIDISGWSVQYASATGPATPGDWAVAAIPAATTVAPGKYYLVALATGATGAALPVTPDLTNTTINLSGTAGKVALVNNSTAINGTTACSAPSVVDVLGYGTTATCAETTLYNPTGIDNTKSIFRKTNGCTETNNNSNDFELLNVAPRNSATAANICGAATPILTATALPSFGNVCVNTTAGPNSFTITGSDLTTANVTVAALPGFSYSTTVGGTYTSTLSLVQPGGAYSQQIFVQFNPTAVQSYNGTIAVSGGGAAAINVAASGSGVNSTPSLTTGAASAITINSATCAGTITSIGCSAITAYGIEWSTTAGFPNGTGTAVPSTNLAGGSFSSNLTGLSPATTYYYHAYATNAGGTGYGSQQSFTTATPVLSATVLTAFGNVCINTTAGPNSFTITGTNLTATNVTVGALAGFAYSTSAGGPYTATLNLAQPGGAYSQQIFVQFTPTLVQSYNGNIVVGGGGAASINVAASGNGVNSAPALTTGAASAITTNSATCAGTITSVGCTAVTAYGIEYSTTAGFPNGSGTAVASTNLAGGNFSSNLAGLAPNTTYYYHAYASNAGGTGYGTEQSFTTQALTPTINTTALTAFGNVCINTTAGPNTFTINGSALNNTNVTVGPLAGYSFATAAGGPYTASLSLVQPGGTYTQTVYVNFTPTAVQSYNGNIPVGGGGAATVNVAASGSGISTAPTVTSGVASAITSISATVAGSIPATGCTAVTAYGIEFSTTNGFPNGSGTAVASSNLAGGNFTSALTGLTPGTVYYYHAYATNGGGTSYGAQGTFTTATPGLSASALTAFGNVCLNTVAGPNSFTITGTNLTTANVSVGPLAGYTFSTTSGGTYTASLSLTQSSGAYSQQVFVRFTPTVVQSYNGNIPVSGGGAAAVNVAASGAGINTAPSVTSGAASAITQTSATVAGTIPAAGCTAVTAYGIEYSTTNGFPNGSGTQAASSNLSGVNFSSALTGLTPSTTYYYKAYATNAGGTSYGVQLSFTTATPVLTATPLTAFGANCINTTTGPNTFTIISNAVLAPNITVGPLNGYAFATTAAGPYSASLSLVHAAGPYNQTIYVQFTPTAVQSYNGNIPVGGGGAATINVAASGSGINTTATVVTGNATVLSANDVTLAGNVSNTGCSPVSLYGFEYSSISGLANGQGTKVPASNLAAGNFSTGITGLVQGATYYYRAYATNNGGTSYGTEKSFTMKSIADGFVLYGVPVKRGGNLHYTYKGLKPGHYSVQVINSIGQLVLQHEINTPVNFIDDQFTIPGNLSTGAYSIQIVSPEFKAVKKRFMVW